MMWVITRPGSDKSNKLYWCVYASGDRWNSRPSHAKVFSSSNEARTRATELNLGDFEVEQMK